MKDFFGKDRGRCNGCNECEEYQFNAGGGNACDYCGCKPTQHQIKPSSDGTAPAAAVPPTNLDAERLAKEKEERERKEREEKERREKEERERKEREEREKKEREERERKEREEREKRDREERIRLQEALKAEDSGGIGGIFMRMEQLNAAPRVGDLRLRIAPSRPLPVLPPDVLKKIFMNLSANDLCQVSQVCKSWRTLANDPTLWSEICKRLWSNRRLFSRLAEKDGASIRWKLLYLKWRKEVMANIAATSVEHPTLYSDYQKYWTRKKKKTPDQPELVCYKQSWFPVHLYLLNPNFKKKELSMIVIECNNQFWVRSSKLRQLTNNEFEPVSFVVKEMRTEKEKKAGGNLMELKTMIGFELGKLLQEQVLLADSVLENIIVFLYAIACAKNRWPEVLTSPEQLPVKKNNYSGWKMADKNLLKRIKSFSCILDFTHTILRGGNLFLLISTYTSKAVVHEVHEVKFKFDTTKPAHESTELYSAVLATAKESL